MSVDPIDRYTPESPPMGLNLYQYGLWNPIRYMDPTGMNEEEAGGLRQFASELDAGGFAKQLGRKLVDDFVQNNQADSPKSNAAYRWAADKLKDSYEKPDSTSANGVAATVAVAAAGIISPNKAGVANAVKRVGTQEALAAKVLTETGELRLSASVAEKYAATRPYVTPLTVQEAIAGGVRVPDPQGVAGRFMYTVDFNINKSVGKFEVLVNELTNTVEHALFKSGK